MKLTAKEAASLHADYTMLGVEEILDELIERHLQRNCEPLNHLVAWENFDKARASFEKRRYQEPDPYEIG